MTLWTIEPRDPLVVRDGRPNNGRSESSALSFPNPSTLVGMVRTRLGTDENGTFDAGQDLASLLRVAVRGPLLARLDDGMLYVPPPRDAVIRGNLLRRLVPIALPEGALFDAELEGKPIGFPGRAPSAGKALRRLAWWPWNVFARWLAQPDEVDGGDADALLSGGLPTLPVEARTHVTLSDMSAAEDGMLFQARGLRFTTNDRRALALAFDVDTSPLGGRVLREGIGPGGGKRRLLYWQTSTTVVWPELPEGVRAALERAEDRVIVRVVLLTPAIFEAGHRPGAGTEQLLGTRAGITPELIAMCVPRPDTLSGWDVAKRQPKKTRRLVPAGSIYWLELIGKPAQRARWAEEVMMTNVSDAEQDRLDGFGLAAVGVAS